MSYDSDVWKKGVRKKSQARTSMPAQGWLKFKNAGKHGWYRTYFGRKEVITYTFYTGSEGDSLAYKWGYDLGRKRLPRSFVEQIAGDYAGDYAGTLFAQVLLRGFDDFHRPAKRERVLLDYELEALR